MLAWQHVTHLGIVALLATGACSRSSSTEEETPSGPCEFCDHEDEAKQPAMAGTDRPSSGAQRWGAGYFPNIELTNHLGQKVRFFDDLIKDKVVVINFIFTSCAKSCPLETARLKKVQNILGDRVGQDVFMYSISIDPKVDTPEVLADYASRFRTGPGWYFLTGDEAEIISLRRKLGLYIEEIQKMDPTDHNLSLIIGNQSTGQWMKRSPMENPYFLAMQIGGWLHNWKMPDINSDGYENAPKLRSMSKGEELFRTRCTACHSIGDGNRTNEERGLVGPDLYAVTDQRSRDWLQKWLSGPDKMLAAKDPTAMALYVQYRQIAMPNLELNSVEIDALLNYLEHESARIREERYGPPQTG